MSVIVSAIVWRRLDLSGGLLLLALALADRSDDQGGSLFPSVAHLADKTRQHERHVKRQLKFLQSIGWLQVVSRGGRVDGANVPNRYQINALWIAGHVLPTVPEKGGDKMSPHVDKRGDFSCSQDVGGDMTPRVGVTSDAVGGGTGVTLSVSKHQYPKSARRARPKDSAPAKSPEERVSAARAVLATLPDYPIATLRRMYGLSEQEVQQVQAPSAEYSKASA